MWETLGLKVAKLGLKNNVVGAHLTYFKMTDCSLGAGGEGFYCNVLITDTFYGFVKGILPERGYP